MFLCHLYFKSHFQRSRCIYIYVLQQIYLKMSRNILPALKQTVKVIPAFDSVSNERTIQLYHHKVDKANVTVLYVPGR